MKVWIKVVFVFEPSTLMCVTQVIGERTDMQRSELSCSAEAVLQKWVNIACNSRPFVDPFREKVVFWHLTPKKNFGA